MKGNKAAFIASSGFRNAEEREDAPTRPAWIAFEENQRKFEREEKTLRESRWIFRLMTRKFRKIANADEWKILKEIQKTDERIEFFADGKSAFSELRISIYREVARGISRALGRLLCRAKRDGGDSPFSRL